MNKENFGLTNEQMLNLKREIIAAKSLDQDEEIVPASKGEVEAIEIAYQLQCRIDKAIQVVEENPGILSTLIRDILILNMDRQPRCPRGGMNDGNM